MTEEEGCKLLTALLRRFVGVGIGLFAQGRLDEALGLAIGLRGVGPGALVGDAKPSQCYGVAFGSEGRAVVGHHALDPDAVSAKEAERVEEEGEAGAALLVRVDLGVGQPRMVVDG